MRINTNVNAIISNNHVSQNVSLSGKSMEKLSTGLNITTAGDDAAWVAVSEKMRAQIRGMEQAKRNVQDGISMVHITEGALEEASNIVQRIREIGLSISSDIPNAEDRAKAEYEVNILQDEMMNIATDTRFNGREILMDGNTDLVIQMGANRENLEFDTINLKEKVDMLKAVDISNRQNSQIFIKTADEVMDSITRERVELGAIKNRLEYAYSNLNTYTENLTSSESRIRDVDVAKEMVSLTRLNVLTSSSQAILNQANQQFKNASSLLK